MYNNYKIAIKPYLVGSFPKSGLSIFSLIGYDKQEVTPPNAPNTLFVFCREYHRAQQILKCTSRGCRTSETVRPLAAADQKYFGGSSKCIITKLIHISCGTFQHAMVLTNNKCCRLVSVLLRSRSIISAMI